MPNSLQKKFDTSQFTYYYKYQEKILQDFSNSEAEASELLDNLDKMFHWYHMDSVVQIFTHTLLKGRLLPIVKGSTCDKELSCCIV